MIQLRERLQNEQKAIAGVESALQTELRTIGEEISALTLQSTISNPSTIQTSSNVDLCTLSGQMDAFESKLPTAISDLTSRIASIQRDLDSSLLVSDRKAKKLDELYREANAENEALYERFNDELGKVLKGVKGGQGVEEMKAKLKDAQEEAATLRKENQKLKRERIGLRSQLKGE